MDTELATLAALPVNDDIIGHVDPPRFWARHQCNIELLWGKWGAARHILNRLQRIFEQRLRARAGFETGRSS
jgi:hypothetical protein